MSDGGKGSAPRPYSVDQATFASNWDRTFSRASTSGSADGSNPSRVGSSPTPAAKYIDADTGEEVAEDWWPEITTGQAMSSVADESARLVARDVLMALRRGKSWEEATRHHTVLWGEGIREQMEAFAKSLGYPRKGY